MAVLPPDPVFVIRSADMGPVNSLCFHQNERLLAGTETGTIHLWDLQTNRSPLHFDAGKNPVTSLHHANQTLVTQEKGGTLKFWDLTNTGYQQRNIIETNHSAFCRSELFSDGQMLACPQNENDVVVLSADDSKELFRLTSAMSGTSQSLGLLSSLKAVDVNSQTYIITGYESGMLMTWDLRVQKVINQEQLLDDCPMALDYDLYTNRGLCAGPSNQITVFTYQQPTFELKKKLEITIKNPGINCLRIRSDQKVFASAGWDGRIRIFSWKSLRPLAVLTEHRNGGVSDIVYSTGKVQLWNAPIMAAGGADGQISLWDLYN